MGPKGYIFGLSVEDIGHIGQSTRGMGTNLALHRGDCNPKKENVQKPYVLGAENRHMENTNKKKKIHIVIG